ncbi:DUF5374 domain-containing protein [Pasteurella canis]|uniref:Membrane protein n=1 Tax=Pasteurella canis TaxID=753 RepID=A0A379ESL4_9PAST|nr:DUF5374 domain-containing protein [Pasteurella canis]MXN88515.1 hypothetical protein [Pasteurella canis]UAX42419.1 DUF5374 domain-containing protein [Pasteurella canis]UAY77975.1 DUF5374 domain-containing protein [Pasteurella canis]UDW84043.1 DUF5374 domain-containing protein [Pasteurella canis]UEA17067.1 DUF5374 domain-containing protein [Pasteurella canis]
MILKHYKGMTLLSLLVTLSIFSVIFLSINQWLAMQRQCMNRIYHETQVIQIAENQKQRQFLGLDCEKQTKQNSVLFQIKCTSGKITVSSPFAQITL